MNTMILYDSISGRTGRLALIIASRLGDYGTVKLFRIYMKSFPRLENIDVLIIGCPTSQQGLSASMQAFLERLPAGALQHIAVATFDTCHHLNVDPSNLASHHLARRLQQKGAALLVPPYSFFLAGEDHLIDERDVSNASHWSESIHEAFKSYKSAQLSQKH